MKLKNDYNNCLTNLACSIQKYFGLSYHHNSLAKIDNYFKQYQPKNVVLILFDGMGSRVLKRDISEDSFFLKHQIDELTSVYPATTTAATTSLKTGLNPVEHCWLGWDTYLSPIDKTITLFRGMEKGKNEPSVEFQQIENQIEVHFLTDLINDTTDYHAAEISHFGDIDWTDLEDMKEKIIEQCQNEKKTFLYVYDTEPDSTEHRLGPDAEEVKELIRQRNAMVEDLCSKLKDTLVIVVADHGHIVSEDIHIEDYPELYEMLERTTSIETRACSYKVKPQFKEEFAKKFNELFGQWFTLLSKEEVVSLGLFGTGEIHPLFLDAIGDYISVSNDSHSILDAGNYPLYSAHAGYTDDEIYVPLIVNMCK